MKNILLVFVIACAIGFLTVLVLCFFKYFPIRTWFKQRAREKHYQQQLKQVPREQLTEHWDEMGYSLFNRN